MRFAHSVFNIVLMWFLVHIWHKPALKSCIYLMYPVFTNAFKNKVSSLSQSPAINCSKSFKQWCISDHDFLFLTAPFIFESESNQPRGWECFWGFQQPLLHLRLPAMRAQDERGRGQLLVTEPFRELSFIYLFKRNNSLSSSSGFPCNLAKCLLLTLS